MKYVYGMCWLDIKELNIDCINILLLFEDLKFCVCMGSLFERFLIMIEIINNWIINRGIVLFFVGLRKIFGRNYKIILK